MMRGATLIAGAAMLLAACSTEPAAADQPTPIAVVSPEPTAPIVGTVTETKTVCTLVPAPGPIHAGTIGFLFVNQTGVFAGFDVFELPQGKSYADAVAFVDRERHLAEQGQPGLGHTEFFTGTHPISQVGVSDGKSRTETGYFEPSTYVVACLRKFEQVSDPARPFAVAGPLVVAS